MNLKKYLKKVNQEHLLTFYNEINLKEKIILRKDIKKINFNKMNLLYKNSFFDEFIDMKKVSNLKCIHDLSEEEYNKYYKIGEQLVKNGEYAIVIMAGGKASRLGKEGPKGCVTLNIKNKEISLFEIFINQLIEIYKKYGVYIDLYIMTSSYNNDMTIDFFNKNNYFNYPKEKIKFFKQHDLPILDINGKILLKNKYSVVWGSNGNGDVFNSLKRNNLINNMKKKNIKYILFSTVDNVLSNLIDFSFIGSCVEKGYDISTKTLLKDDENSKNWVFCKYKNKPYMLPSNYINKDITNLKGNDGDYLYRDTNITYHMISLNCVEKFSKIHLKYHRAYKKNNYMDLDGKYIKAQSPNSFKFEKFIFDAFFYSDNMLLYRINNNEFFSIKKDEDIKKAEKIINKI